MLVDRIDEKLKSGNRFRRIEGDLVFRFIEKLAAEIVNPGPVCMEVAWEIFFPTATNSSMVQPFSTIFFQSTPASSNIGG